MRNLATKPHKRSDPQFAQRVTIQLLPEIVVVDHVGLGEQRDSTSVWRERDKEVKCPARILLADSFELQYLRKCNPVLPTHDAQLPFVNRSMCLHRGSPKLDGEHVTSAKR